MAGQGGANDVEMRHRDIPDADADHGNLWAIDSARGDDGRKRAVVPAPKGISAAWCRCLLKSLFSSRGLLCKGNRFLEFLIWLNRIWKQCLSSWCRCFLAESRMCLARGGVPPSSYTCMNHLKPWFCLHSLYVFSAIDYYFPKLKLVFNHPSSHQTSSSKPMRR